MFARRLASNAKTSGSRGTTLAARLAPGLALGLVLVLGALPASADHRRHERRDDRLEQIAQQLQRATDEVYRDAHAVLRRPGDGRLLAFWGLRDLDRQARTFRSRLAREGIRDTRTTRSLRELERRFRVAERRLAATHATRELRRDFARVERLMERLDQRVAQLDDRRRHRRVARRDDDGPDRRWRPGLVFRLGY